MNKYIDYLKSTRPKQWIKNLLVYSAPLLHSGVGSFFNYKMLGAFLAMIMLSGSVYILNDLRDYKLDQTDSLKVAKRPILSGRIGGSEAKILALLLAITSCIIFQQLGTAQIALLYLVINLGYNFGGKKIPYLEIAMVCSGYPLRSWLGAEVGQVPMTWSLTLSITFGAIAMICAKRVSGSHPANEHYGDKFLERLNLISLIIVALISFLWAIFHPSFVSIWTPMATTLAVYRVRKLTNSRKLAHTESILKDKVFLFAGIIAVFSAALHLGVLA